MTAGSCSACGAPLEPGAAFCEACGTAVGPSVDAGDAGGVRTEPATDAIIDRSHYELGPATWVGGVCDRGIIHHGNEDALAIAARPEPDSHAALVVCDGVTTALHSDVASLAAARAALDVLATPLSRGVAGAASAATAAGRIFARAARAAQEAVLAATAGQVGPAGACTLVAAVVDGPILWHAAIGDSRVYLLPDDGEPVLLTRDDSMAEMLVETGMARERAERTPLAHTITRWLGIDAPDVDPHLGSAPVLGPSWLLVCSDGLWNYASAPEELLPVVRAAERRTGPEPILLARELVRFAIDQGGHDNITVALARVGTTPHRRPADDPLA